MRSSVVAYLKSSETNAHDVHICGSVVFVMGMFVVGRRMVCSDSGKSMARWCDESVVAVETTARKRAMRCAL